jgi:2-polyprenyl-3-methyl-5-hydroxy-6-metoxy-1,4-benzoquinol methylase
MKSDQIRSFLSEATSPVVNAGKRWLSGVLPYRPMNGGKEVLNAEYSNGTWDYLRDVEELSRFSVVVGYCHYFKDNGSILEIGCGEGILQERLDHSRYSRYMGVDISSQAIGRASQREDQKTSFVAQDAKSYSPNEKFDLIIFNECLEYFDDPLGLVKRYDRFMNPDGLHIVSMFAGIDTARTRRIWKMLESKYTVETETKVSNRAGYIWVIKAIKPANRAI